MKCKIQMTDLSTLHARKSIYKAKASVFIVSFNALSAATHANAVAHGFWDPKPEDGTMIALMHGELSECLEGLRHGNPPDDKVPEFSSAEVELADCILYIMNFAAHHKLQVAEAIIKKVLYNETRPFRHGKKF